MAILQKIALGLVALLSLAAGVAKIMKAPQEVAFFESLGIDLFFMIVLGTLQIASGLIILVQRFRVIGAIIAAISFSLSAAMIWITGQIGFAMVSVLPVALAIYVIRVESLQDG